MGNWEGTLPEISRSLAPRPSWPASTLPPQLGRSAPFAPTCIAFPGFLESILERWRPLGDCNDEWEVKATMAALPFSRSVTDTRKPMAIFLGTE